MTMPVKVPAADWSTAMYISSSAGYLVTDMGLSFLAEALHPSMSRQHGSCQLADDSLARLLACTCSQHPAEVVGDCVC